MEPRTGSATASIVTDRGVVLLERAREKGVRFWLEEGRLRYKAPKNALTDQELEQLRDSKNQIVALLEEDPLLDATANGAQRPPDLARSPLAFSQLQHWKFYQLDHHPAFRHLLSVQRLRGRLDEEAVRRTVEAILHRQNALRTRIRLWGPTPWQEVASSLDGSLEIHDLSAVEVGNQWAQVTRQVEQLVMAPIDVAVGPLLGLKLLRFSPWDHVLMVAMEHIIADMWSVNLFVRDFLWGYRRAVRDGAVEFPPLALQFADYATWQRSREAQWLKQHGPYWEGRLRGCGRLRFPGEPGLALVPSTGWTIVPVVLDTTLSARLRRWCRARGTTVVLTIFTAYVALVLRWCGVANTLIRFESNGRVDPRLLDVIGYFTSPLYLRVSLCAQDTFVQLLNRVTLEYCSAYEHADASYLESHDPRPEFARNTAFNWIPALTTEAVPASVDSPTEIRCEPLEIDNPRLKHLERDTEPFVVFFDSPDALHGGVWFPLRRFSTASMESFAAHLQDFVNVLVTDPSRCVMELPLRP
jgi:hypothetical protein